MRCHVHYISHAHALHTCIICAPYRAIAGCSKRSISFTAMSSTEETDFGQAPIIYPEGFIKAVAEDSHRNGHASSSSGGSGSSSSNTSQTQLVQVRLEPLKPGGEEPGEGKAVLDKERHPSSSSGGKGSEVENEVVQEYYCGVGRCRPSWMQKLRDARFFTFLLCCNCFIEGALVSGRLIQSVIQQRQCCIL